MTITNIPSPPLVKIKPSFAEIELSTLGRVQGHWFVGDIPRRGRVENAAARLAGSDAWLAWLSPYKVGELHLFGLLTSSPKDAP